MSNLHLRKILGRYVFRRRIPTALIKRVGRKELIRGIGVCAHAEAIRRARLLAVASDHFFEVIMANENLTRGEIEALARRLYLELIVDVDRRQVQLNFGDPSEREAELRSADRRVEGSLAMLEINNWRPAIELVDQFAEMAGVSIARGTDEHRQLCHLGLRAFHQANLQQRARLKGNYGLKVSDNLFEDAIGTSPLGKNLGATTPPAISLFELIAKHVQAMSAEWTAQTSQQNSVTFRFLKDQIGDLPVSDIGKRHLSEFDGALKLLPFDYGQQRKLRGKTLHEVLTLDAKRDPASRKLSQKTVNRHMSAVSGLFSWAEKHGYWEGKNLARVFINKKRASETERERRSWKPHEIKSLLDSHIWRGLNVKRGARFFVPLLGLYAGLTLDEACKLQTHEIRQLDDFWVIDIVESIEGRLKEKARARTLPIHPKLIDFGFLAYVDTVKKYGGSVLWPELTKGGLDKKRSSNFTKWFGRHCKKLELKPLNLHDPLLDFHSFRHNVGEALAEKGIHGTTISNILGHASNNISLRVYSNGPGLLPLMDAILTIDYGIDLSHLVSPTSAHFSSSLSPDP